MTPLMKWLRKQRDKWLGTWEEGPEPPERLRLMVVDFANRHLGASRKQWVDFATGLAGESYRSGYLRGFDYTERTHDWRPDVPPEVLADWVDPAWRSAGGIELESPEGKVPQEEATETDIMRRQTDEIMLSTARRG